MKKIPLPFFLLIFLLLYKTPAIAQSGALDPSFGNGGSITLHPEFKIDQAQDVALKSDGKIIALSNVNAYPNAYALGNYFLQFNSDGTPDESFGEQGKIQLGAGFSSTQMEVDAADRIVVYGLEDYGYYTQMILSRYLPDGSLDESFGNNGEVLTGIAVGSRALLVQQDGKIVVGGQTAGSQKARLKRLNENGSEDLTFNSTGSLTLSSLPNSCAFNLAEQADGKILVTGTADGDLFVIRLNTNGTLDNTFANGGLALIDNGAAEAGQGIALMPDGRIIISGHGETEHESRILVWALLTNGAIDNSFGTNGLVTLHEGPGDNFGWFVFPLEDSSLVVGSSIFNGSNYEPALYHVFKDGNIDSGFGTGGVGGKTFVCGKSILVSGLVTPAKKIILCGTNFDDGNNEIALSQFLITGQPDTSFALNSTVYAATVDSFYYADWFYDLTTLSGNRSLSCGRASNQSLYLMRFTEEGILDASYGQDGFLVPGISRSSENAIIATDASNVFIVESYAQRFWGIEDIVRPVAGYIGIQKLTMDGLPDSSFGTGGIFYHEFTDLELNWTMLAAIQPDGKVLIAGELYVSGTTLHLCLFRFNTNGTIDSTFDDDGIKVIDWQEHDNTVFVAVRSDGKIMLQSQFPLIDNQSTLRIGRFLPDGSPDPSFGSSGISDIALNFSLKTMFLLPDNKMFGLITSYTSNDDQQFFQLNEDGTIDTAFGNNGYAPVEIADFDFKSVQIQADGKILCSGNEGNHAVAVARYLSNGTMDESFGSGGIALIEGINVSGQDTYPMRIQDDDKILMGGNNHIDIMTARLLNDIGTGTATEPKIELLNIYPNPVTDQLFIQNPFPENSDVLISVIDISGRVIIKKSICDQAKLLTLNVTELPEGFYTLRLTSAKLSTCKSFIKLF